MPTSLTLLLKYPLAYCIVGIVLALLPGPYVRAEWSGLLILSALIVLYAYFDKGERDFRRHEVGDNCYFIGFVYTLAIITAALVLDTEKLFGGGGGGEAENVSPLLKTIGIALGTSVVGMLCRFGLKYGVEEIPEDQFEQAVNKAAAAATNLNTQVTKLGKHVGKAQERFQESIGAMEEAMGQSVRAIQDYSGSVERESKKVGESMSGAAGQLLEDFGRQITDSLQKTHFDSVRESLQATVEEHRKSVSLINELLSQSLTELDGAAKVSVANVDGVKQALYSLEDMVGGSKWAETNNTLRVFSENVEKLNRALQALAGKQAEAAQEAEKDIQRLKTMQAADLAVIAEIKENYRKAFEQAEKTALEETHRLYSKLILGATVALGGIDNLGQMSQDLRTIARNIEHGGRGK